MSRTSTSSRSTTARTTSRRPSRSTTKPYCVIGSIDGAARPRRLRPSTARCYKARNRDPMSQNWKQAPPARRPDALPATDESERFPALYAGLKRALPPVLRRLFAFRVSGLEHLPARGPYIVAANHANYLDGVVLASALPRKISFLVMPRVYRATPLHPYFHNHVGSIPVSLARPDPGAIRRALRIDRKSTRLNSSHLGISYAVFCLKKKKTKTTQTE